MNFRSAFLLILVIILLKPKKTSTMGRKGPRAKTKIVLKSVSKVDQLGLVEIGPEDPNFKIVQSCVLSEVIGIAWAVHHVGACVAHTEQVWSTGFHSGSNAYYITPRSQT